MRLFQPAVFVCAIAVAGIGTVLAGEFDEIKGKWKHHEKSEPRELSVDAEGKYKITWYDGKTEVGKISLTTVDDQKGIDLTISEGKNKDKVRKGLYSLADKKWILYVSKPGGERPTKLEKRAGEVEEWIVVR